MKSTVPIPPIEIQNEIVRILDNFTDLEADLKAELEARTQQYEYYRNKLLDYSTGFVGLPKIDKMIKELCPNGIITSNFESITTNLSSGKNTMKNTTGEYPVYGSTGKIGFTNEYKYEGNSILIARVGANCGLVYFVSEKYDVTDNTILVKIKTNQNIKYFFYLLKNMNLNQFAKGGGQPLITSSLLKSLEIPLPPLEIQNEIVKILDSFSDLVTSNSEGLPAEIKARKQQFEYYRNKLLNFEERQ
jgi:type I restriction enzyme S subunit